MISGNGSTSATTDDDRQGWTSSPDGRGTMSIVWSCAITAVLCCWSVLIINVPEPRSSRLSAFTRKLLVLGLCAAAPEVIFQIALGQWISAHNATLLFHRSGFPDWTLRHSFYVDMGGFHLRSQDYPTFPINSEQLHFLVTREYVAYPRIEENQIRDKNKVDGTLRFITLIQTLYFTVNLLVRAIQGLAITALELSTAALVVLSVGSTIFWLRKPADVERCEFIESTVPIAMILANDNLPADLTYTYTPLDFTGRKEWSWSILWMHGLNVLRRLHIAGQPQQLPARRVQNTVVPIISGWYTVFFAALSLGYLCLFIAGWNYTFPTPTERMLWRSASLTALISASLVFTAQQVFFKWIPAFQRKSGQIRPRPSPTDPSVVGSDQIDTTRVETGELLTEKRVYLRTKLIGVAKILRESLNAFTSVLRNNSPSKDPALEAPIGAVLVTWVLGAFYMAARGYIVIADFIELRSLPSSAYKTLNWSSLAPFIP